MAVVTSFTYSGLQTYLFYILLILHYYLYFVCNTHCLTIGICGSFLVFFFLFVSKCQFSTFSFPISICAHLSLDIMWFFLIRQKNWRGTENASFIFYPWKPVSEGVAWLRTSWLSYIFSPFHSSGNDHVNDDHVSLRYWVLAAFPLWFPEWSSPIPQVSAATLVLVPLFTWWSGVSACLVASLSYIWSHRPADSQL